jgi:Circularly permutated YpsA SLOG family
MNQRTRNQINQHPGIRLEKIVSGGQTGVDRGALQAALIAKFPCGGWCPDNRLAEDGTIPALFPLTVLPGANYPRRTWHNVKDSDATVLIFDSRRTTGGLNGGTWQTRKACKELDKPYCIVDARSTTTPGAALQIIEFLQNHSIRILNVAGPRASKWPEAQVYALAVIYQVLAGMDSST